MKIKLPPFLTIAVVALVGVAGLAVLWLARESLTYENLRLLIERIAGMGPVVFFTAMAILPLFWMPVSPFLLLAPAFGTWTAVGGCVVALTANMTIAWFVSGKWCRPFLEKLVRRNGYKIPQLSEGGMIGAAVMIRITPGVPFPFQNYVLGLAGMSLGKYLLVSVPIACLTSSGIVLAGNALVTGNLKMAMLAVGAIVVVALALRWARRRFGRGKEGEDDAEGAS